MRGRKLSVMHFPSSQEPCAVKHISEQEVGLILEFLMKSSQLVWPQKETPRNPLRRQYPFNIPRPASWDKEDSPSSHHPHWGWALDNLFPLVSTWHQNGLALQTKVSSAGHTQSPGPNDSIVGGRGGGGWPAAKEGPWWLGGRDTYPDCGEPLVVQLITPWGKRRQRSWYLEKSYIHPQEFRKLLSACRTWKVQNLENHTEARTPLPEGAAATGFFLRELPDSISVLSTNPNPPPCLLDRGQTP